MQDIESEKEVPTPLTIFKISLIHSIYGTRLESDNYLKTCRPVYRGEKQLPYETPLVQHSQLGHIYVSTEITDKWVIVDRDVNRTANQTSDPIGRACGSKFLHNGMNGNPQWPSHPLITENVWRVSITTRRATSTKSLVKWLGRRNVKS